MAVRSYSLEEEYHSVEDLIKWDNPNVWVRNTSDLEGRASRGELHINILVDNRTRVYVVPDTWVPIDLSNEIPKDILAKSMNFRSLVTRRYLAILTNEEAKALLAADDAKEEVARLRDVRNSMSLNMTEAEDRPVIPETDGVAPFVVELVNRDDLKDEERVTQLRGRADSMTIKDFRYIVENAGANTKMKTFALSRLSNMSKK